MTWIPHRLLSILIQANLISWVRSLEIQRFVKAQRLPRLNSSQPTGQTGETNQLILSTRHESRSCLGSVVTKSLDGSLHLLAMSCFFSWTLHVDAVPIHLYRVYCLWSGAYFYLLLLSKHPGTARKGLKEESISALCLGPQKNPHLPVSM